MSFSVQNPPSMREFRLNIEAKMKDDDFIGDTAALLSYNYHYDPFEAYEIVLSELLS